jgi:hypothetical protein
MTRKEISEGANVFENTIMGHFVDHASISRDRGDKFYVSCEDFDEDWFAPYLLTSDLADAYFRLSEYVYWPPFSVWLEDVYIGMLSIHLGVDFVQLVEHYYMYTEHNGGNKLIGIADRPKDSLLFVNIYEKGHLDLIWNYFANDIKSKS